MARWLIAVATAVLVSCGGSSSPTYNGGINGTPPSGNSGFVFTPADGAGLVIGPVGCTVQSVPTQWSGLLIGFSSDAGMCGFARAHGAICMDVTNGSSTFVAVFIFKGTAATITPVAPGTYTLGSTTGTPLTELVTTGGSVTVLDATCGDSGPPTVSGTITINTASAAQVTGSVNLTWTGGGFSGPFDVVGCTVGIDICAFANGNAPTCSGCF